MADSNLILNVVKSKLPSIQFVARLNDSDIIGVEQEYILVHSKGKGGKNNVEVDYETVSGQGEWSQEYLPLSDAVGKYNISRDKIYNLCKSGEIVAFQEGNGKKAIWWIQEESLRAYLETLSPKKDVKKNKNAPKNKKKNKKKFGLF